MDELQGEPVGVWPDNLRAVLLFQSMESQWRVGFGGPYGLDYNVLYHKMDRMKLSEAEYDELENDIRILEDAALITMLDARNK